MDLCIFIFMKRICLCAKPRDLIRVHEDCFPKTAFGRTGFLGEYAPLNTITAVLSAPVRTMQELYGNKAAGRLMSAFSRLFTHFLQGHGFTCGIDDVLLSPAAELERANNLSGAEQTALVASASVAGLPEIRVSANVRNH